VTRYPRLEPLTREVAGRLGDAASAVAGHSLRRVGYRFGLHSGWPDGYARGEVDEVGTAVVLGFDNGIDLIISLVPPGRFESVDTEAGAAGSFPVREDLQFEADVSQESLWSGLLGSALEGVRAAWEVGGQLAVETVWAVRLTIGERRVVIALVEVDRGVVSYNPSAMLVFFDEHGLRSYQDPVISLTSLLWQPVASKRC
jgi:hypothetical protein